jgi:hypothetical protein
MGVTGASSEPVAKYLQDRYFCILPTSTAVLRSGQKYVSQGGRNTAGGGLSASTGRCSGWRMLSLLPSVHTLAMALLTHTTLPVQLSLL